MGIAKPQASLFREAFGVYTKEQSPAVLVKADAE
jgi:hypothetical protein